MEREQPTIAIIGATGALGFGLTLRLSAAGLPVTIGSRTQDRAEQAATKAAQRVPAGTFSPQTNINAVQQAGLIFLCVPFRNHSETLTNIKSALRPGQIIVDATVPLAAAVSGKATRTLGVWQGSAAQQAAEMVPSGVHVVGALHTISAAHMSDIEHELSQDTLLTGDSTEHKAQVAYVLEQIPGLRCVDAGKLEMARLTEQVAPLLISINSKYKTLTGMRLTGLPNE